VPRRAWFIAGLAAIAALVVARRRNRRIGRRMMNEVIDPWLIRQGIAGGRSELGTLEHFGRRTGTRHLTPVHPVATEDGFRIVVPLGWQSEWARNVLAAGHCRLQLANVVFDLDEPAMLAPHDVEAVGETARRIAERLGFMYLRLHRFAQRPGRLDEPAPEGEVVGEAPVGSEASVGAEQPA
jgi:hypothetical protein